MAQASKLWYLENFNLFENLEMNKMEELGSMTTMKDIPKNQPIYFAHEPSTSIFFLKEGRVKLTRTDASGKEMILTLVKPGEVFGELSILDENERNDYAIAIDKCLICAISKNDFKNFIEKNPGLNLKITRLIGLRLKKYSERIEELVFKDAPQRIISFLLSLCEESGKKIGDEYFVKPFLKHQDIAELTACSRQTVNAILTDLREQNLIDFDRRNLIIRKKFELEKML
ncbi:MAG: Crp/Fnr family transcriptional regulator [Melioribacteraceae bacterium]|nr:Crp/Fnr family transcriptional regulator [Melioribacteraceae bacterium]